MLLSFLVMRLRAHTSLTFAGEIYLMQSSKQRVSIIDYGVGNIASVVNMVKHVGGEAEVVNNPSELETTDKLLLPGVGAFDHGMGALREGGWLEALDYAVQSRCVPILGICLGMQLMCKTSEEGVLGGLCWIDATVKRFDFSHGEPLLKVPHMGWSVVKLNRGDMLTSGLGSGSRYYFVHSYFVTCHDQEDIILTANYGQEFVAGFHRGNIWGVQFHPEKSHKFGMKLLKNFIEV